MFKFLDAVKWLNPQNEAEKEDIMVVEGSEGVFVEVRHLSEDGYGEVTRERMEDLKFVGRVSAYERAEEVYNRYKNS